LDVFSFHIFQDILLGLVFVDASMSKTFCCFLQHHSVLYSFRRPAYNRIMLKLSKHIHGLPVMSLRTGGRVALATRPIINPNNLQIEGWRCEDSFSKEELILLKQDVRDFVPQGIAVDDHDVLTESSELVRLQEVLELDFEL